MADFEDGLFILSVGTKGCFPARTTFLDQLVLGQCFCESSQHLCLGKPDLEVDQAQTF